MNPKWQQLAGEMLVRASQDLSANGSNDWPWPKSWTPAERLELARAMVADNIRCVGQMGRDDEAEARALATGTMGPPDWWVALYLAKVLKGAANG